MGQYKFSIYVRYQLGVLVGIDTDFIKVQLPFLEILIGRNPTASGFDFFGL